MNDQLMEEATKIEDTFIKARMDNEFEEAKRICIQCHPKTGDPRFAHIFVMYESEIDKFKHAAMLAFAAKPNADEVRQIREAAESHRNKPGISRMKYALIMMALNNYEKGI